MSLGYRSAFGLLIATIVTGCGDPCAYNLVMSEASPDRQRVASFFKKNCGATSGYVYEVKVGDAAIDPLARSIVLRFDNDHQVEWPEMDDTLIDMQWIDEKTLSLRLSQRVRVFKDESAVGGVAVRYSFKPGTNRL